MTNGLIHCLSISVGVQFPCLLIQLQKEKLDDNTIINLDVCIMNLSGCCACDECKRNGGHCIRPDDSDEVIQKIVQADAVIFGTPVYWWGMSSQLKMVVDKFYAQDAEFKTMRKKIGVVEIGANTLEDPQYRLIREQFSCIGEYLGWELSFSLSFSAYEPAEICRDKNLAISIKEAIAKL